MPTLGPVELLFLFGVLLGAVILVIFTVVRARAGSADGLARLTPDLLPPVPAHVQQEARTLWATGRKVAAIKLVRDHTGLGLKEAKLLTEALGAGLAAPSAPTGTAGLAAPDLATRVRGLKAAGRTEQAVFLVRGETGMDQTAAEAFVNAL